MKGFLCKLLSCLGLGKSCQTEERRSGPETRRCGEDQRHIDDRRSPTSERRDEIIDDRRDQD